MKKTISIILMTTILSANLYAATAPHTWHQVISEDGAWSARLQMINENGYFVARDGNQISTFSIDPSHLQEFGFGFDAGADFDIAYTLTLTQQSKAGAPQFSSKACVYVVTAAAPAQPDIRPSSFNGAVCNWNVVPGVGENFTVS